MTPAQLVQWIVRLAIIGLLVTIGDRLIRGPQ